MKGAVSVWPIVYAVAEIEYLKNISHSPSLVFVRCSGAKMQSSYWEEQRGYNHYVLLSSLQLKLYLFWEFEDKLSSYIQKSANAMSCCSPYAGYFMSYPRYFGSNLTLSLITFFPYLDRLDIVTLRPPTPEWPSLRRAARIQNTQQR